MNIVASDIPHSWYSCILMKYFNSKEFTYSTVPDMMMWNFAYVKEKIRQASNFIMSE